MTTTAYGLLQLIRSNKRQLHSQLNRFSTILPMMEAGAELNALTRNFQSFEHYFRGASQLLLLPYAKLEKKADWNLQTDFMGAISGLFKLHPHFRKETFWNDFYALPNLEHALRRHLYRKHIASGLHRLRDKFTAEISPWDDHMGKLELTFKRGHSANRLQLQFAMPEPAATLGEEFDALREFWIVMRNVLNAELSDIQNLPTERAEMDADVERAQACFRNLLKHADAETRSYLNKYPHLFDQMMHRSY